MFAARRLALAPVGLLRRVPALGEICPRRQHGHSADSSADLITVTFVKEDKTWEVQALAMQSAYSLLILLQAPVGIDLLSLCHKEDIDLEGACEGSIACSTCHVILQEVPPPTGQLLDPAAGRV